MKYAISILRSDKLEYKKERYETLEKVEKVYLSIPESERADYGIAQIHTDVEIKQNTEKLAKEQREYEDNNSLLQAEKDVVIEVDGTVDSEYILVNGKSYMSVEAYEELID